MYETFFYQDGNMAALYNTFTANEYTSDLEGDDGTTNVGFNQPFMDNVNPMSGRTTYEMGATDETSPTLLLAFWALDSDTVYSVSRLLPFELEDLVVDDNDWSLIVNFCGYESWESGLEFAVTWHDSGWDDVSGTTANA